MAVRSPTQYLGPRQSAEPDLGGRRFDAPRPADHREPGTPEIAPGSITHHTDALSPTQVSGIIGRSAETCETVAYAVKKLGACCAKQEVDSCNSLTPA